MTNNEKHLSLCACVTKRRNDFILTGPSALIAHGIARLDHIELRPHASCSTRRKSEFIRWHYRPAESKAKQKNGLLVVNPICAIIDAVMYDTPDSLLVSINHCLFNKLFSKQTFITELSAHKVMKGQHCLERLIWFATAKCESPLETIAWIAIYKAGLVMPQQQMKIGIGQNQSAFVDMYWEIGRRRVILELDGRSKYSDNKVLFDEKLREDKLRAMGYEIIRCVWNDVTNGRLIQLLTDAGIPRRRYFGKTFPVR